MEKTDRIKLIVAAIELAVLAVVWYIFGRTSIETEVTVIVIFVVWIFTMILMNKRQKRKQQAAKE